MRKITSVAILLLLVGLVASKGSSKAGTSKSEQPYAGESVALVSPDLKWLIKMAFWLVTGLIIGSYCEVTISLKSKSRPLIQIFLYGLFLVILAYGLLSWATLLPMLL